MLKEIQAKTILHYHARQFATNWDANIYRGCGHNCRYCFAQYSHRYLDNSDFFDDVFVKSNAPELLQKEMSKRTWDFSPVNVCGISDCYQPAEAEYKIMPKVINSFIKKRNPLFIGTKSTLILRDFHLIEKLNKVAEVSIATSVSSLDEGTRKLIEPSASPTIERLKMLKKHFTQTKRIQKIISTKKGQFTQFCENCLCANPSMQDDCNYTQCCNERGVYSDEALPNAKRDDIQRWEGPEGTSD